MNLNIKKALENTSWLFAERVAVMCSNLIVSIVLARSFSPEGFGALSYLLAFIAIVKPISSIGFNAIVTRELINGSQSEQVVISTAVGFRVFGAVFGCLCCLLLAFSGALENDGDYDIKTGLVLLAFASLFSALNVLEFWFQAHVLAKLVAKMRLTVTFLFSITKIIWVFWDASLLQVVSLYALESIVLGLGFLVIFSSKAFIPRALAFSYSYGVSILRQSFWLIFSAVAAVIYLKIDQVMLKHMVSSTEVGVYSVASRISEVWYFFAEAIVITLFPKLLDYKNDKAGIYEEKLQQTMDLLFSFSLVVVIIVLAFGRPVILILFGSEYSGAASILHIHIFACIFIYMRSLISKWLIAENFLVYSLVSHGAGAVVNVIVNLILIPKMGGEGAALATLISYFTASYLIYWLTPKSREMAKMMNKSMILLFTLGARYWPVVKRGGL